MKIATTRSGRIIVYKPIQSIGEFIDDFRKLSDADKFDFYCVFQWLAVRALRKYSRGGNDLNWWIDRMDEILKAIDRKIVAAKKSELKIVTSHEMVNFGSKMCTHFWRKI